VSRFGRISVFVLAVVLLSGCTLHLAQSRENNVIDLARYSAIGVGLDKRREVMAALGPPDRVFYGRSILVFDYLWARHRSTDARFFVPSQIIPGFDPLVLLSLPRFFFDLAEHPEEFQPSRIEQLSEAVAGLANSAIPFSEGQDLLIARGYQLRHDRVRIVFDRASLVVQGKSMRFASGEYRIESLANRILLRVD